MRRSNTNATNLSKYQRSIASPDVIGKLTVTNMRPTALLTVARAYVAARFRQAVLRDRGAIERYQRRQLQRLMRRASRELPFYAGYAERPFVDWPVVDKQTLLDNFAAMNRVGLEAQQVRDAVTAGEEQLDGHLIGMSTGTSGNRGYYVITEEERFLWLGTILAKALPDALWRRHRVALALPALSGLYRSASVGSRIDLRFFDLAAGPETWVEELAAFAPDTIVAPPKVLRWLAERGKLGAETIFSGAEVLDPLDRALIEDATGHRVREIYMATEGLFGVGCAHGTLHLAEDVVHFEYSQPDHSSPLLSPIVTDFTRRSQAMIRYRMNDLVELDHTQCACGSAFQAVKRIEGRRDDAFLLPDATGTLQMVTPDVLRNAVVDADPGIRDYRVVQDGAAAIVVSLDAGLGTAVDERVRASLMRALAKRGVTAQVTIARGIAADFTRKLRRVRREWQPPA
jgi:putative adenylate-forming enzyme